MLLPTMKKLAVIITIAILFSVFVFSTVELINENPDYGDFCVDRYSYQPKMDLGSDTSECEKVTILQAEQKACSDIGGGTFPVYDDVGCISSYECDTCQSEFDAATKTHRLIGFIMSSVLGLIAVLVGIYANSEDEIAQWIYSGFMIGGIISIFFGTIIYFQDMERFLRPVVMLAEIALIIFVAIKTAKRVAKAKHKK